MIQSDSVLVAAALSGKTEAFGPIIERYKGAVFGVTLARLRNFHDAEDVTQATFIEAFERLGSLKDTCRLGPWLRLIAVHRCINFLRRRDRVVDFEAVPEPMARGPTPQEDAEWADVRAGVMDAIGRLSKTQRETVTLYYIGEYSLREVAAVQEVPLGTVKRRLHDARKRLKAEMVGMVEDVLKDGAPKADFAKRVFDLLCQYPTGRNPYGVADEPGIQDLVTPGIEGFAGALSLPHWKTRWAAMIVMERVPPADTERVIVLLKQSLDDTSGKIRARAIMGLTELDVSEDRKRREFLPLVVPHLQDASKRTRHQAIGFLHRYAADAPLEAVARAVLDETDPDVAKELRELMRAVLDAKEADKHMNC